MKNIFIYIISAFIMGAVLFLYIDELGSYGISLTTAVIFAVIILLFIIISKVIFVKLYKKLQNKDRKDSE